MKRTKIICTLGPSSDSVSVIKKLINCGMNVARLNFSHNTLAYHARLIKKIRAVAKGEPVAILQDLQGPRLRIGDLGDKIINVRAGQELILTTNKCFDIDKQIPVSYARMHKDVSLNQRIMIADGFLELKIKKIKGKEIYCRAENNGIISSHKGINLPDSKLNISALTEKDKKDLAFGLKNNVDFVGLSFARNAKEVDNLKKIIERYRRKLKKKSIRPAQVVVKIERKEAIGDIDAIIEAADAVMVARGDLGIELPAEDVPLIQKMIIDKCLHAAKPVIVATQLLQSMIDNPRPTRAEASDVANAVIDHADAVMLSGETANGKYPVESAEIMKKIIIKTENSVYDDLVFQNKIKTILPASAAIGATAKMLSENAKVKLILINSNSTHISSAVSRYRPEIPIFVSCPDAQTARQINLTWGTAPFILPHFKDVRKLRTLSINYLKVKKIIRSGDRIILIDDDSAGAGGKNQIVEIKEIDCTNKKE